MQVALGKSPETEPADNTHLLSKVRSIFNLSFQYLRGQVCILFTDKGQKEIQKYIDEHKDPDFAKAGQKATFTVFLQKGVEAMDAYGHGMEPYLRQLGLPTKLNMQKIELLADTYVCREGEELSVEQTKILKILGHQMATFDMHILASRT